MAALLLPDCPRVVVVSVSSLGSSACEWVNVWSILGSSGLDKMLYKYRPFTISWNFMRWTKQSGNNWKSEYLNLFSFQCCYHPGLEKLFPEKHIGLIFLTVHWITKLCPLLCNSIWVYILLFFGTVKEHTVFGSDQIWTFLARYCMLLKSIHTSSMVNYGGVNIMLREFSVFSTNRGPDQSYYRAIV